MLNLSQALSVLGLFRLFYLNRIFKCQKFISGVFMVVRRAASVVVLPEPVGPVTSIIPYGFATLQEKNLMSFFQIPILLDQVADFPFQVILKTIFSP